MPSAPEGMKVAALTWSFRFCKNTPHTRGVDGLGTMKARRHPRLVSTRY